MRRNSSVFNIALVWTLTAVVLATWPAEGRDARAIEAHKIFPYESEDPDATLPREGAMPPGGMRSESDRPSVADLVISNDAARPRKWANQDDRVFLSEMTVHHQAAVAMAKAVLSSAKDEQVREWAGTIIKEQEGEMRLMQSLLVKYGGMDEDAAARMNREMGNMMLGGGGMEGETVFLAMMIRHHAMAIEMALPVLAYSANPQVQELAEGIIVEQAREIAVFRAWLLEHEQSGARAAAF